MIGSALRFMMKKDSTVLCGVLQLTIRTGSAAATGSRHPASNPRCGCSFGVAPAWGRGTFGQRPCRPVVPTGLPGSPTLQSRSRRGGGSPCTAEVHLPTLQGMLPLSFPVSGAMLYGCLTALPIRGPPSLRHAHPRAPSPVGGRVGGPPGPSPPPCPLPGPAALARREAGGRGPGRSPPAPGPASRLPAVGGAGRARPFPPPAGAGAGCPSSGPPGRAGGACGGRRGVSRKWPYWIHSAASTRGGESRAPAAGAAPAPAMAATDLERFSVSSGGPGPALVRASPRVNNSGFLPLGGINKNAAAAPPAPCAAAASGCPAAAEPGGGRRLRGVGFAAAGGAWERGEAASSASGGCGESPCGKVLPCAGGTARWEAPRPRCSG